MFTGIKIYCPEDTTIRSYVHTRIAGKRVKVYNGKSLGISCFPNECYTLADRKRELQRLAVTLYKKLSDGWNPFEEAQEKKLNVEAAFKYMINVVKTSGYAEPYIRDLTECGNQFLNFLKKKKLNQLSIEKIKPETAEEFLHSFTSSGTYYMNKRRNLSVLFSKLITLGYLQENPMKKTTKRKVKAKLHESYKEDKILGVFAFLKENNRNLYLCAILMYGTLLRPHREIRLLTRKNFADDLSYILLDGYRNKSGSIRKTPTPEYVRATLIEYNIDTLNPEYNIFTGTTEPLNVYYFNLMWGRAKKKMLALGLVNENQTLYSFRHSAAVDVFSRHQNLHLVQKLFAHSSLTVSLTYLRSIGMAEVTDEASLPKLSL